jgi:peptidoglycan/LPS O-acetylase OafA/YrhL
MTLKSRFDALDGLRGVASLVVVVFHFMSAFSPDLVPDQSATVPWWVDTPVAVLYNGIFSVAVFFVLSGFVLAHTSQKMRTKFSRDLFIRYLRLALPATASILMAWALLKAFPVATLEVRKHVTSSSLGLTYQGDIPSIFVALKDGLFGIFVQGGGLFNGVLWTMKFELIGSFGVYTFFQFCRTRRLFLGLIILAALVLLRAPTAYVAFALGSLLYIAWADGKIISPSWALMLFSIGLILGSQGKGFAERHGLEAIKQSIRPGNTGGLIYPIGALFLVAGVLYAPQLKNFFSNKLCKFLGEISFPLYLVHVPIIYTIAALAVVGFNAFDHKSLIAIFGGFILLAIIVAYLFERYVDQPTLRLNKHIRSL